MVQKIQRIGEIKDLEELVINNPEFSSSLQVLRTTLPYNGNTPVVNKRYPAILYSKDNGSTYDIIKIPEDSEYKIPNLGSIPPTYTSSKFNSAFKFDNSLWVSFKNEEGDDLITKPRGLKITYTNGLYSVIGDGGPRWETLPDKIRNITATITEGAETVTFDQCTITMDKMGNYLYIQPQSSFAITEGLITNVASNSITVKGTPDAEPGDEIKLLAITSPSSPIPQVNSQQKVKQPLGQSSKQLSSDTEGIPVESVNLLLTDIASRFEQTLFATEDKDFSIYGTFTIPRLFIQSSEYFRYSPWSLILEVVLILANNFISSPGSASGVP
ncbi:MAG: hypothetical protein EZS28_043254, partial [Streblomastix strix]